MISFSQPTRSGSNEGMISLEPSSASELNSGFVEQNVEQRKSNEAFRDIPDSRVVTKNSRLPLSWLELLAHSTSISYTVVIIWLCGRRTYFADTNHPAINTLLNTFQFVAAIHAGVIAASLTAIALYHLRYELCVAEGVPFEHFVTSFQLSSIFTFFKPQFWRPLLRGTDSGRTYVFGLGLLLATILQTLANPLSAILTVPQLRWWEQTDALGTSSGFGWINASHSALWPDQSVSADTRDICNKVDIITDRRCPFTNIAAISRWSQAYGNDEIATNVTITDRSNVARNVEASFREDYAYTVSTTAMDNLVGDLGTFWSYASNVSFPLTQWGSSRLTIEPYLPSLPLLRPLVQVQCDLPQLRPDDKSSEMQLNFPSNLISTTSGSSIDNITTVIDTTLMRSVATNADNNTRLRFANLTSDAGISGLGLVAGLWVGRAEEIFPELPQNSLRAVVIPCRIVAHWIPSNISVDPQTQNTTRLDNLAPDAIAKSDWFKSHGRRLDIDFSWANWINLAIAGKNRTVLDYEVSRAAPDSGAYNGAWGAKLAQLVSTIVSLQVCDGLAHTRWLRSHRVFCDGCSKHKDQGASFIQTLGHGSRDDFQTGRTYTNQSYQQVKESVLNRTDRNVPVQWRVRRYGYGWGLDKVTSWIAVAVLSLHAALALAHIGLATFRRLRFCAWDELAEVLALANKSPAWDGLQGASVGLDARELRTPNVKICAVATDDGVDTAILMVGNGNADIVSKSQKLVPSREYQ